jgi:hypothetical protein
VRQGAARHLSAGQAAPGAMFGPVMGMGIACGAVGAVGRGLQKVKVDAVHGFRPG